MTAGSAFTSLLWFIAILALIPAALWLLKRTPAGGSTMQGAMRTVALGTDLAGDRITGVLEARERHRVEVVDRTARMRHVQQREDHWAIVDLHGIAGHTRTVPVPDWVKGLLDCWTKAAAIPE